MFQVRLQARAMWAARYVAKEPSDKPSKCLKVTPDRLFCFPRIFVWGAYTWRLSQSYNTPQKSASQTCMHTRLFGFPAIFVPLIDIAQWMVRTIECVHKTRPIAWSVDSRYFAHSIPHSTLFTCSSMRLVTSACDSSMDSGV
jgi:hypothetical protein